VDGHLTLLDPAAIDGEPALALRLYDVAVEHDLPVAEVARRTVRRAASAPSFCEKLRSDQEAVARFRRLLCTVRPTRLGRGSLLRELHDVGLLVAMIPEFAPVVGRVHHDTYHVFTVDEHSVAAVDHLASLVRGTTGDHALACRLAAELPQREVLFFAALLHDVGKVLGGKGHSERGAAIAEAILERLGFRSAVIERVQTLIRLHLKMYLVATRRDIEDPRTLSEFCNAVGSQEVLRELYLLTVADVTTTSPSSMTAWKRGMLDTLQLHADRTLAQRNDGHHSHHQNVARRAVLELWPEGEATAFIEHFSSGLPDRYLLANDPRTIVEHARFALGAQSQRSSLRIGEVRSPYAEVWVVADDRPGLLASIAKSFREVKFRIMSAQVYSWVGDDGKTRSMDLFWVRARSDEEVADHHLKRVQEVPERPVEPRRSGASCHPRFRT
jgi:[protein-PII] uridylyltransferase